MQLKWGKNKAVTVGDFYFPQIDCVMHRVNKDITTVLNVICLLCCVPGPVKTIQYEIRVGGIGSKYIFFQMPSVTQDEVETLVFIHDQANTVIMDCNETKLYTKFKKLKREKTYVYFYKAQEDSKMSKHFVSTADNQMIVTAGVFPHHYEGSHISDCIYHASEVGDWWNIYNVHHIIISMMENTLGKILSQASPSTLALMTLSC